MGVKKIAISLGICVLLILSTAQFVLAKDAEKPIPATDVELVKKVSLKAPSGQGSKAPRTAATGVLGTPCSGNKYAIIIGISDGYPGTANDLEYGDDDAREVYADLTSVYGYSPGNIRLLIDNSASYEGIRAAVENIKGLVHSGDEVFFFFSGHGGKGKASDGDREATDESIVTFSGNSLVHIWDGELAYWFDGIATDRIIFVFDSCLSGGMNDLSAPGRIIITASSETGLSYEGDQWGNGQFTYYFFEQGIVSSAADRFDHDGTQSADVTAEEAFDYAKPLCRWQSPQIFDGFTDDILP